MAYRNIGGISLVTPRAKYLNTGIWLKRLLLLSTTTKTIISLNHNTNHFHDLYISIFYILSFESPLGASKYFVVQDLCFCYKAELSLLYHKARFSPFKNSFFSFSDIMLPDIVFYQLFLLRMIYKSCRQNFSSLSSWIYSQNAKKI